MSVNARLEAAQAHFGQSAETLSLCLNLRQRKVRLVRSSAGQWLTDEREPRMGFSAGTVQHACEAGMLSPSEEDEDGPTVAVITKDGLQVADDVLAWLRMQNAPALTCPSGDPIPGHVCTECPPEHIEATLGKERIAEAIARNYPERNQLTKNLLADMKNCERKASYPLSPPITYMTDAECKEWDEKGAKFEEWARKQPRYAVQPNIIEEARKNQANVILHDVIEQIGDESLVGASYTKEELREQMRAGFARWNLPFDDLHPNHQDEVLTEAATKLEEEWGLVQMPEEDE